MDNGNLEAGYNPPPHTSYTRGYLHQVFPVLFHQICKSRLQSEMHPSNYDEYTAAKYKTPNTRWNVSHKHLHFFPPSSNVCGQTSFSLNAWTPVLPSASAAINLHTGAYQCTVFFLLLSSLLIILKPSTSVKWYTSFFSSFVQILSPICYFPISLQAVKLQDCRRHKVLLSGLFLIQHMEP